MPVVEISKLGEAQYATECIICEKIIPVQQPVGHVKVCDECKNAVFELKFFLSQIKPCNPILMERLKKHRASMDVLMDGGAE